MEDENFQFIQPGQVRVRYAPSPTGFLHLGGARTALFNYLFARRYQGRFILRIEDTDRERSKKEYEKDILESLQWLGLEWDEGPLPISQEKIEGEQPPSFDKVEEGKTQNYLGEYGPYRQSERLNIYEKYLKKLLDEDKAYWCFCSEGELSAEREYQISIGQPPHYSGKCASLSKDLVKKYFQEGKKGVIRFRLGPKKVKFEDLIRGEIEFDLTWMGDFIIAKDFLSPLYNFSVVVDDFEMKISHVIRGEEHISNTPKQILLAEALGFPQPKYAHLPLILGPNRTKLSKRHGAVAISDYKKDGYLPEALVNFMAFLGWNPGTERQFYSISSLIKEFSLERVQKSGAIFIIKKLDFLNGFYIRQKAIEKLTNLCLPYLIEAGFIEPEFKEVHYPPAYGEKEISLNYRISETKEKINLETIQKIVFLYQERLKKLSEIPQLVDFFFKEKLEYDKNLLRWSEMTDKEISHSLDKSEEILSKIEKGDWNKENLEKILIAESEKFTKKIRTIKDLSTKALVKMDRGYLLWPLRVALTGKKASAGPFEIAEILGKEKTIKRIREAKKLF